MTRLFLSAVSVFALVSCGGGGDGTPPAPPAPSNAVPSFTSPAAAEVAENTSGTVYVAEATDADGDAVTYAISGGPDAVQFALTAAGELSFIDAPDFEAPADAEGDNIYGVIISATDPSGAEATLPLEITVADVVQTPTLARVGSGFTQPLYLTALPDGSGRVAVVEKGGRIRLLDPDTGAVDAVDMLDISATISTDGERGLLGLAFAPDYATSGLAYLNVTNPAGDSELRRYSTVAGRLDLLDPTSGDVLLEVAQPFSNHNAGWLGFAPDGTLIIPFGDGGSGGDPQDLTQDPTTLLGKVVRIDVSGDDFPNDPERDYRIPDGNSPSAGDRPEIFATGLRNPFRASFDPVTGDLLLGDVGQSAREEINRLSITAEGAGTNFGWPIREGTLEFKGSNRADLTPPVAEYGRDNSDPELNGRSVTGGEVYRGPVEALQGSYVFADFSTDNIWAVPLEDLVVGETVEAFRFDVLNAVLDPDEGSRSLVAGFGTDAARNLYVVSLAGDVFRLEAED